MNTQVDVLLSTFNNSTFLSELLRSLNLQTYKNFKLFLRDDGSDENIKQFIHSHISSFKNIEITNSKKNVGYFHSFCNLINSSKSELIFLCDHDDVWHIEKIERYVAAYEQCTDKNIPILIYSDLNLIDENGQLISTSFFKAMNFSPNESNDTLFMRNSIPGCAIAFNQPLKELFQITKKIIPYHDHILILLAIMYGKIIYIDEKLIFYRIHSSNTLAKISLTKRQKIQNLIDIYRFNFSYKKFIESNFGSFLEQIKILMELDGENNKNLIRTKSILIKDLTSNKNRYFAPRDSSERIKLFFLR